MTSCRLPQNIFYSEKINITQEAVRFFFVISITTARRTIVIKRNNFIIQSCYCKNYYSGKRIFSHYFFYNKSFYVSFNRRQNRFTTGPRIFLQRSIFLDYPGKEYSILRLLTRVYIYSKKYIYLVKKFILKHCISTILITKVYVYIYIHTKRHKRHVYLKIFASDIFFNGQLQKKRRSIEKRKEKKKIDCTNETNYLSQPQPPIFFNPI